MMTADIACESCGTHLGTITKRRISTADIAEYRAMAACHCTAVESITLDEIEAIPQMNTEEYPSE